MSEAAELLGVEERAVRLMAASGDIEAIKRGNAWWLDRRAVERRGRLQPGRGRRLSPAMAWSVLLLASGVQNDAEPIGAEHHPRERVGGSTRTRWPIDAPRLSARARRESFDAHPSELDRLASRADVMRTGISAAELVGVHGGGREIELYAPACSRDTIVDAARAGARRWSRVVALGSRRAVARGTSEMCTSAPRYSSTCSSTTTRVRDARPN